MTPTKPRPVGRTYWILFGVCLLGLGYDILSGIDRSISVTCWVNAVRGENAPTIVSPSIANIRNVWIVELSLSFSVLCALLANTLWGLHYSQRLSPDLPQEEHREALRPLRKRMWMVLGIAGIVAFGLSYPLELLSARWQQRSRGPFYFSYNTAYPVHLPGHLYDVVTLACRRRADGTVDLSCTLRPRQTWTRMTCKRITFYSEDGSAPGVASFPSPSASVVPGASTDWAFTTKGTLPAGKYWAVEVMLDFVMPDGKATNYSFCMPIEVQ